MDTSNFIVIPFVVFDILGRVFSRTINPAIPSSQKPLGCVKKRIPIIVNSRGFQFCEKRKLTYFHIRTKNISVNLNMKEELKEAEISFFRDRKVGNFNIIIPDILVFKECEN